MRILHIVGTINPAAGGPTEVIRTLLRFAPAGYECEVATLDDPAASFLRELEFPVHALGSAKKIWYVPALSEWLVANRLHFDGVMVHGLWEYTGLAAWRALRGRVPYAVFTHGMLDPYFKRAFPAKHAKKWVFWNLFQRRILADAHAVLFTTALEEKLARESFANWKWKPLIVAIGAEAPPLDSAPLLAAFYAQWPQLQGKRFLLFLGRIDAKKGPDLLLRAFADVCQDNDLSLVMAGPFEAEYKREIEAAAPVGRVHWVGMLRGDVKWGAFFACEAFVLPSHQENFGIAIVEALACGRPVLISNQINIYPEIEADGCGFVESDTLEGAQSLLTRWLATPSEERAAMGTRALQTFLTRYDMRKNAETILRVFDAKTEGK